MTYCAVSYRQAIGASCIRPQAGMSMCAHSENNHYCGTEFGLIVTNPTKGQCMIACATLGVHTIRPYEELVTWKETTSNKNSLNIVTERRLNHFGNKLEASMG